MAGFRRVRRARSVKLGRLRRWQSKFTPSPSLPKHEGLPPSPIRAFACYRNSGWGYIFVGDKAKLPEPWQKVENWQSLAIASAIITLVLAAFTVPWIFAAPNDQGMLHRVQIVAAGMAVGLAVVTFCTVIWRGLISAQQADLQRLQIDKLAQQIAATEENNLAQALQKGAELLAEDKPAYVAAAIATLESIATAKNPKFATEAMNLIADFIDGKSASKLRDTLCSAAINSLWAGAQLKRVANRSLHFSQEEKTSAAWRPVVGVHSVSYWRGSFRSPVSEKTYGQTQWDFDDVSFLRCRIDSLDWRFENCTFKKATVEAIDCGVLRINGPHDFTDCDFSGCRVADPDGFPDLRAGRNYFAEGAPPIADSPRAWEELLLIKRQDGTFS